MVFPCKDGHCAVLKANSLLNGFGNHCRRSIALGLRHLKEAVGKFREAAGENGKIGVQNKREEGKKG